MHFVINEQFAEANGACRVIAVWPGLAPGEQTKNTGVGTLGADGILRVTDITAAQILLFPAAGASTQGSVLVIPGGGYNIVAAIKTGTAIAHFLNALGFTAAVLTYRTPQNREGAFQDAQRAVRELRYNAGQYGIDPKRLGVIGFSAGAHLSARLAVQSGVQSYAPIDAVDQVSARPGFAALVYPAYLIDETTGQIAPEVAPHSKMPPCFLTQTMDDSYLCAPTYEAALRDLGVPTRGIFYANGGHGYGLELPESNPAHVWLDELAVWLRATA